MNSPAPLDRVLSNVHLNKNLLLALLLVLSLFWLLPFTWVGSKLAPLPFHVPDRLWQQYACAGLFTQRVSAWSDWRIEVRRAGSESWQTLNLEEVSPMPASGHRQRLDRILGDTRSKKIGGNLRLRLAAWIAQKLKESEGMEISGVRYLHRSWPTNTPGMTAPAGHWNADGQMPATTKVTLLGTYAITNGKAVLERNKKPQAPAAVPQPKIFRRANTPEKPVGA